MDRELYTIILDLQGGTYVAQVEAADEREAARIWAKQVGDQRVVEQSSTALAKALLSKLDEAQALVPLDGLQAVWCLSVLCGRSLALVNIVRTR